MRSTAPLFHPIPGKVIDHALWWLSGKVPRQKNVSTQTRLVRSWTRAAAARQVHVRAPIGDAIRWALYDWRPVWTEADFASAVAEVTRRIDARRLVKRDRRARVRQAEYTQAFNRAAAATRRGLQAANALEQAEAYLRRARPPAELDPAGKREIRARIFAQHTRPADPIHVAGRWWTSRAAYDAHVLAATMALARKVSLDLAKLSPGIGRISALKGSFAWRVSRNPGLRLSESFTEIPTSSQASVTARNGVSLGQLASLAAEFGSRRL